MNSNLVWTRQRISASDTLRHQSDWTRSNIRVEIIRFQSVLESSLDSLFNIHMRCTGALGKAVFDNHLNVSVRHGTKVGKYALYISLPVRRQHNNGPRWRLHLFLGSVGITVNKIPIDVFCNLGKLGCGQYLIYQPWGYLLRTWQSVVRALDGYLLGVDWILSHFRGSGCRRYFFSDSLIRDHVNRQIC